LLDQIETEGVAAVALPLSPPLPDPDDAPFLEVAVAARANALITGNTRHYPARARQGITVLDPAAFLDRWSRQRPR
jgi:predicted nucleic acid-binding protein